jgi:TolB-like protein/class 3 adenylate cyclase
MGSLRTVEQEVGGSSPPNCTSASRWRHFYIFASFEFAFRQPVACANALGATGEWRPTREGISAQFFLTLLTRLAPTYQLPPRKPHVLGLPLADPIEVKRRLAAIFAADVEGYSRLMGTDEVATLDALTARREILDGLIATHGGRIANTAGDSVLAEFGSAVDAVRCAMEAQVALAKANSTLPEARHINFRIGVHVGDVMVRAGDLFGDGVNIAARLQTLARAGGLCVSGVTYDQVRKILPLEFTDLGAQTVKNIEEAVRTYEVRAQGGATPSAAKEVSSPVDPKPLALPDKPSIAVLPFQNMSGDPEQDYFADGVVEDIITALSRFKSLFVIARNSSFTYKGKAVDIKQVGRELGVRYVLEGSVRKAGGRLRITGQLIDVTTSAHLWADRFDGALEDIFDLQDKVAQQVIGAIAPEIDRAEIERASRRPIGNVDAVTEYYRGAPHIHWPTGPENNDAALRHFENAIARDPTYSPAYGGAAMCLMWRRTNKWPRDNAEDDAQLLRFAERVKELNTDDALTLSGLGFALVVSNVDHNYEVGIDMVDRAIRSNPNCASAYNSRGFLKAWNGGSDTAIADFEHSMRLSPRDPFSYTLMLGMAFGHYNAGRYAEAANCADKAIRAFPYFVAGLHIAIMCYVGAGRIEDAQRVMADCLRMMIPNSRRSTIPEWNGLRSSELRMKMREALLKAGLPE